MPDEAAEFPLAYEMMSSEDEETVMKVTFLTETAQRLINDVRSNRNCISKLPVGQLWLRLQQCC